jgi:hypothetical protein
MKRLVAILGPLVLIGTLLVSIPRYAAAFIQAEPTIWGLPTAPITGLGFGLLLELGIYYVIDSWFDARRRGLKFHWVLLIGVVAQLVLGPLIVAPAIVGHLRAQPGELGKVLDGNGWTWAWAAVVAAAPALLLAAVAAASTMREPAAPRSQARPAERAAEPAERNLSSGKPARARYACRKCPQVFSSQPALNAHQKAHAGKNGKMPATSDVPRMGAIEEESHGDRGRD